MNFLIGLLFIAPLFAQELKDVQVTGSCDVKVVPDRGSVSFTAENQFKDQKQAVKKTNDQINKLKEAIQKLKLDHLELKNTSYTVQPIREYENNRVVEKGIRASMTLDVTTSEISRLGEAMLEASKVGIQNVGTLTTFLSHEKAQTEYLKCLDVAAEDAKKKAQQLARKLGFKLGAVTAIIEAPTPQPTPGPYPEKFMAKGAMMDAAPVAVEAGTQNFTTTLQVSFAIK